MLKCNLLQSVSVFHGRSITQSMRIPTNPFTMFQNHVAISQQKGQSHHIENVSNPLSPSFVDQSIVSNPNLPEGSLPQRSFTSSTRSTNFTSRKSLTLSLETTYATPPQAAVGAPNNMVGKPNRTTIPYLARLILCFSI